ncbi:MAG TPA: type II toxin-antitoxin system VapC family toxin [Blastocatellia bacterium]|jgi:tRNA(fMet)-specific endonuclease VapC
MTIYLLDTDHLSLIQRGNAKVLARFLATPPDEIAASVVSYEEQTRGWLGHIKQARNQMQTCEAYDLLCGMQQSYCKLRLLEFNQAAYSKFEDLRRAHPRSGKRDLRIAATALVHDLTLVTRNTQDFISIANLRLENWA